jgi:hypothetical protein
MSDRILLTAAALFGASLASATSNDMGFDRGLALDYCEDLAESYQVLDEDRSIYLSRCVHNYREEPPGDQGSDISPHAAGY